MNNFQFSIAKLLNNHLKYMKISTKERKSWIKILYKNIYSSQSLKKGKDKRKKLDLIFQTAFKPFINTKNS